MIHLKIPVGDWFKLPFMGKEVFVRLAREAQLKYDSKRGFMITPSTKLDLLKTILTGTLNEEVEYSLRCSVCGKEAECETCIYNKVCDRTVVSRLCICDSCRDRKGSYALYSVRFAEMLE